MQPKRFWFSYLACCVSFCSSTGIQICMPPKRPKGHQMSIAAETLFTVWQHQSNAASAEFMKQLDFGEFLAKDFLFIFYCVFKWFFMLFNVLSLSLFFLYGVLFSVFSFFMFFYVFLLSQDCTDIRVIVLWSSDLKLCLAECSNGIVNWDEVRRSLLKFFSTKPWTS